MLNDVWNSLVSKVEATKKHYNDLEASMVTMSNHLNDGLLALLDQVNKLEDKFHNLHSCYEDLWVQFNKQQCTIYNMDKRISFYSQSIIKLENKKAQAIECQFEEPECLVTGQDDQMKVLQAHLTIAERGCCRCGEETPKVISCHCFLIPWKLTEDAQEPEVTLEIGGLEYEDGEVEAFHLFLIVQELMEISFF